MRQVECDIEERLGLDVPRERVNDFDAAIALSRLLSHYLATLKRTNLIGHAQTRGLEYPDQWPRKNLVYETGKRWLGTPADFYELYLMSETFRVRNFRNYRWGLLVPDFDLRRPRFYGRGLVEPFCMAITGDEDTSREIVSRLGWEPSQEPLLKGVVAIVEGHPLRGDNPGIYQYYTVVQHVTPV